MKYLLRLLLSIFLFTFLIQCSNKTSPGKKDYLRNLDNVPKRVQDLDGVSIFKGDVKPKYSVELIPKQTFGKSGKPYLTMVVHCIVDDKGRVIIDDFDKQKASRFANILHVFNADGSYSTKIGGAGKGPGEYGLIMDVQAKAGKVIIFDNTSKRLNIYNGKDYSLERTFLLEQFKNTNNKAAQGLKFEYIRPRTDGNYLVTFSEPKPSSGRTENKYLLMNRDGQVLDYKSHNFSSLLKIKNSSPTSFPSVSLRFMGETVKTMSEDDAIYSAWSQDFLIKKYDSHGAYQSAIYYKLQGSPFDLSDYTKEAGYSQDDVMDKLDKVSEELPEANPVIADLKVDDKNRIWVAVPTGVGSDSYEWWILGESGQLLANLDLPRDKEIYDIKDGFLYSKKTNKETGTEYVVKYQIVLTKK